MVMEGIYVIELALYTSKVWGKSRVDVVKKWACELLEIKWKCDGKNLR